MITRKKAGSKLFAVVLVIVMVITLTSTCLIINAGAISPGFYVSDSGVEDNSVPPTSLSPGEVWTGKTVAVAEKSVGKFDITLMAICGMGQDESKPIEQESDLVIEDTYSGYYDFIVTGKQIGFTLNGDSQKADYDDVSSTYIFEHLETHEKVVFNPTAHKVTYSIPYNALRCVFETPSYPQDFNTLTFGLVLNNNAAAATTFYTNTDDSCIATFVLKPQTITYTNTFKKDWVPYTPGVIFTAYPMAGSLMLYNGIQLDGSWFLLTTPNLIGYDPTPVTTSPDVFRLWISTGLHTAEDGTEFDLRNSDSSNSDKYVMYLTRDGSESHINLAETCTAYKMTLVPDVTTFTVIKAPNADDKIARVRIEGATPIIYEGSADITSDTSWSFSTKDGIFVRLVDANTLEVTSDGSVTQTHDAKGFATLAIPYYPPETPSTSSPSEPPSEAPSASVLGDVTTEPEPSESGDVKGESEVLPQTGGISSSTLVGIFGLVVIAIGGTAFVIFRKKFLS